MRIAAVITSLTTGGAEILVKALSEEFTAQGHEVLVVALTDAESVGNSAETEARMQREFERTGVRFASLGLSAARNPFEGRSRMRSLLQDFRPDVVHAHTARALPLLALARNSARVAFTHHNTRIGFPPILFRAFDRMTDAYVAIGRDVEGILTRHVGKPIVPIANCAGRNFAGGLQRDKPRAEKPQVLSVGAISGQKNYGLVLEIARQCRAIFRGDTIPVFHVVGGGEDLFAMREKVANEGLTETVVFLGERSDVPARMREADLYLNTSLYEGMPLTLLEAMASGLPIIASDVPGNRELVDEGYNGFRASLDDPQDFAFMLERVLSDPAAYRTMSGNALARSREYSVEATAQKHLQMYREITGCAA